jgi:hypothetical protein
MGSSRPIFAMAAVVCVWGGGVELAMMTARPLEAVGGVCVWCVPRAYSQHTRAQSIHSIDDRLTPIHPSITHAYATGAGAVLVLISQDRGSRPIASSATYPVGEKGKEGH